MEEGIFVASDGRDAATLTLVAQGGAFALKSAELPMAREAGAMDGQLRGLECSQIFFFGAFGNQSGAQTSKDVDCPALRVRLEAKPGTARV